MNQIRFAFLIVLIAISSCKKKDEVQDTCLGYVDVEYQFPSFPPNGWRTDNWFEESKAYFAIPESILKCISTDKLITACLNHPQKALFYTGDTWQQGMKIMEQQFNGFHELSLRNNLARVMLNKYQNMNPFDKNISEQNFLQFEILMAQSYNLSKLNSDEKVSLVQYVIKLNENKISAGFKYTDGKIGGYVILGRLMQMDNYKPFMNEFNQDLMVLLRIFVLDAEWLYNDWCKPDEIISKHAIEYLNFLKK
jgi:hypothetical protein